MSILDLLGKEVSLEDLKATYPETLNDAIRVKQVGETDVYTVKLVGK